MSNPNNKLQKLFVVIPNASASKKKKVAVVDTLMLENEAAQEIPDDPLPGQTKAASSNIAGPYISSVSGQIITPPPRLRDEVRTRSEVKADTRGGGMDRNAGYASDGSTEDDDSKDASYNSVKLKQRRPRTKQQPPKPPATVESLSLELEDVRKLYVDEREKNKDLKSKKAAAVKEYKRRRRAQTELKKNVKAGRNEIKRMQRSSVDSLKRLAEKEKIIEETKEALFRRMGKGGRDTLDDNHVHDMLNEVRMLLQDWVSANAVPFVDVVPGQRIKELLELGMPNPLSMPKTEQLYQLFIKERGASRMLLGILVAHTICRKLFQDPFAFLEDASEGVKIVLERVLNHGMLKNPEITHAWRHMTVKLLNLDANSEVFDADKETGDVLPLARVRDSYYDQIVQKIHRDASVLVSSLDEDRSLRTFQELKHLVRTAGDVSALLWAQKAQMRWSKYNLGSEFTFSVDSSSVKAHPCMRLDSENHQYDGRRVQLVIEPAIFASGNEDGKNYDQWKVRLPAIGWLSEEDPDRSTPSRSPSPGTFDLSAVVNADGTYDSCASQHERPAKRPKYGVESETLSQTHSVEQADGEPKHTDRAEDVSEVALSNTNPKNAEMDASSSALASFDFSSTIEDKHVIAPPSSDSIRDPSCGDKAEAFHERHAADFAPRSPVNQNQKIGTSPNAQHAKFLADQSNGVLEDRVEKKSAGSGATSNESAGSGEEQHIPKGTSEASRANLKTSASTKAY